MSERLYFPSSFFPFFQQCCELGGRTCSPPFPSFPAGCIVIAIVFRRLLPPLQQLVEAERSCFFFFFPLCRRENASQSSPCPSFFSFLPCRPRSRSCAEPLLAFSFFFLSLCAEVADKLAVGFFFSPLFSLFRQLGEQSTGPVCAFFFYESGASQVRVFFLLSLFFFSSMTRTQARTGLCFFFSPRSKRRDWSCSTSCFPSPLFSLSWCSSSRPTRVPFPPETRIRSEACSSSSFPFS